MRGPPSRLPSAASPLPSAPPPPGPLPCAQQRSEGGRSFMSDSSAWSGALALSSPTDRPTLLSFDKVESNIRCGALNHSHPCRGSQCGRPTPARVLILPGLWSEADAELIRQEIIDGLQRRLDSEPPGRRQPKTAAFDIGHLGQRSRTQLWAVLLGWIRPHVRRVFPGFPIDWRREDHFFMAHVNRRPVGEPNVQHLHVGAWGPKRLPTHLSLHLVSHPPTPAALGSFRSLSPRRHRVFGRPAPHQ